MNNNSNKKADIINKYINVESIINDIGQNYEKLFSDKLYKLVWSYNRIDLLKEALESKNMEIFNSAKYVLEECASLPAVASIISTIALLADGSYSDQASFLSYLRESEYFGEISIRKLPILLNSLDLKTRRGAIEYISKLNYEEISYVGKYVFDDEAYELKLHKKYDDWRKTNDRKIRAFRIAIMLYLGFSDEKIERNIDLEDSYSIKSRINKGNKRSNINSQEKIENIKFID